MILVDNISLTKPFQYLSRNKKKLMIIINNQFKRLLRSNIEKKIDTK